MSMSLTITFYIVLYHREELEHHLRTKASNLLAISKIAICEKVSNHANFQHFRLLKTSKYNTILYCGTLRSNKSFASFRVQGSFSFFCAKVEICGNTRVLQGFLALAQGTLSAKTDFSHRVQHKIENNQIHRQGLSNRRLICYFSYAIIKTMEQ